jgi:flagellar biosynthetic protein FlhB
MAAEDTSQEDRTEAPSPRRLEQAREEGNVPRSRELSTFAVTMTGLSMLMVQGDHLARFLMQTMRQLFTFDQTSFKENDVVLLKLRSVSFDTLWTLAPIFAALFVAALAAPLLVGGWNITFKPLGFNFGKLSLPSGLKRMFSVNAAGEGGKAVLKSLVIGGLGTWAIWNQRAEIIGLISEPLEPALAHLAQMLIHTFLIVISAMLVLVVIDVPLQLWQYNKSLRMTKEEVKREFKEHEGSPEVKGRIRQLQREAARKRMMVEVPKASVIVTNPTHYAVALKYDEGMRSPQVVAKGALKLAERIIDLGKDHRVAVMRVPSFTRALYFNTEIGDDISPKLYAAAAQVLAYVYQLKLYESNGGLAPVFPETLEVPAELDPETKRQHDAAPNPQ